MKHANKRLCCFLLLGISFSGCSSTPDNQESEIYERLTIIDFAAPNETDNGEKISVIWKGHEFACPVVFQSVPDGSSSRAGFRVNENPQGYELIINGHHLPIKADTKPQLL